MKMKNHSQHMPNFMRACGRTPEHVPKRTVSAPPEEEAKHPHGRWLKIDEITPMPAAFLDSSTLNAPSKVE